MIEIDSVEIADRQFQYVRMDMFGAPLVLLKGKRGFVMCGYLNIQASDKLGDVGIRVTGVKNLDDMVKAKVSDVTSKAESLGIKPGSNVSDILHLL